MCGHHLAILEDGVALSSQLIRAIGRNEGNVTVALTDLFAWASAFSADELTDYAAQIERLVYAASELGTFERLLRTQQERKETAVAYAMGMRPTGPIEFLTAPVRVDRP
ncbi:hypothetical protein [Cryobacterium sp. Y62]|uniref:hypothetical protein n=1 Tax=Cryobacterium sp. Y62 TaxID=2048284 RepID=UPI0011B0CE53|nr:hypothetical protein [Cryobacterium sp. Y62]